MSVARKAAIGAAALTVAAAVTWAEVTWARRSLPQVWTEPAQRRSVVATIVMRGHLTRPLLRTVRAGGTGQVQAVLVRPGQNVRTGQPILITDDSHARAALDGARAGEQAARSEEARAREHHEAAERRVAAAAAAATRQERLWELGLTTEAALVLARYDARAAWLSSALDRERIAAAAARVREEQSRVAEAQRAADLMIERAPIDGVVSDVLIRAGEWAHAGGPHVAPTALFTISDDSLAVQATLEPRDKFPVPPLGWPAVVVFDADPAREWPAHVADIGAASGGAVAVRLKLMGRPVGVRDGMSCTVRVTAASRAQTIAVPNHALLTLGSGAGVWTIARGVIVPVAVRVGLRGDRYSEVLDGLSPGQPVVTGPHAVVRLVRAGDAVAPSSSVRGLLGGRDEGSD